MNYDEQLRADVHALKLQINEQKLQVELFKNGGVVTDRVTPIAEPPIPQSSNQLYNGDLSHSINSWNDSSFGANNRAYCAIFWYSHTAPTNGQELLENFDPDAANNSIKWTSNSLYDADFTDWDRDKGYARITGTTTLDTPMPQNLAGAGKTEYLVCLIARRNQYITLTDTCRFYAGIWDNTSGQRDWIEASTPFTLTGGVVGTPAGTTSRKYRIHARTDRGYDFLTNEVTVAGAPNNGSFVSNSVYVSLAWDAVVGAIQYDIYRDTGGTFELLYSITNGTTSYNDQNNVEDVVGGYPTATDTYQKAYVATRDGEMSAIAVDGVSSAWNTIEMPIRMPANYNQSLTTNRQWVRMGLTESADLTVEGCTTNGTTAVTLPESLLTADHVGLTVELDDGTNTATRTISAQTGNALTLSSSVSWSNSITTIRVVGGGFHGVLVDLIHLSYAKGAVYSPHAEDYNHQLQPVSAPNGSSQGGVGTSGASDDGGLRCLWENEMVVTLTGASRVLKKAKDCRIGDWLATPNLQPTAITHIRHGIKDIYLIKTRNGWTKRCSDSHRVITSVMDKGGTMIKHLRKGDIVLTDTDGKLEASAIVEIAKTAEKQPVISFSLSPTRIFISGQKQLRWWQRLFKRQPTGGILDHNLKYELPIDTN